MTMTPEEIARDYRGSKAPLKQIGILADLNGCTKQEIADVLKEAGLDVPDRFKREPFKLDQQEQETPEIATTEGMENKSEETEPPRDIKTDVVSLCDALPIIAEHAACRAIERALDDLDEVALDVSNVGHVAIIFAERVRGILMMVDSLREK